MCNKRPDRGREGRVSCRLRRGNDDGHIYNPGFKETHGELLSDPMLLPLLASCQARGSSLFSPSPGSPHHADVGPGWGCVCVAVSTLSLSHPNLLSAISLSFPHFFFLLLSSFSHTIDRKVSFFPSLLCGKNLFFNQILSHSKAHFNLF